MKEELVSFETAKLAKEKGFNIDVYKYYRISINPNIPISDAVTDKNTYFPNVKESYAAPTQSLLQKWLREIHNIHINIRYEEYFHYSQYKYFHFDINIGSLTDVTNRQDLHEIIMDECSQNVPGHYLNDKKFSKLIFDKRFAFKSYEEALEIGLQEALKSI